MKIHKDCGAYCIEYADGTVDCTRHAGPLTADQIEVIL